MHPLLRLALAALGVQRLVWVAQEGSLDGDGGGGSSARGSGGALSAADKLGGRLMQPEGGANKYWSLTSGLAHGIREVACRASYKRARSSSDAPCDYEFTHLAAAVLSAPQYRDCAGQCSAAPVVFEEYAGPVFSRLRAQAGFTQDRYAASFPALSSLIEFAANSKSAQRFFFSADGRYMVKTMSEEEVASLLDLLPAYERHLTAHPHSLLTRFVGLYRVTSAEAGASATFIVSSNVFWEPPGVELRERYDLKGSSVGRRTRKQPLEVLPATAVLKDLDLTESGKMRIGRRHKEALLLALSDDASFLAGHDLMDYSLLVGVRAPPRPVHLRWRPLRHTRRRRPPTSTDSPGDGSPGALLSVLETALWPLDALAEACLLPMAFVARAGERVWRRVTRRRHVQMGLIDVLQRYSLRKSLETAAKGVVHDKHAISSVPPAEYATRLLAYVHANFE